MGNIETPNAPAPAPGSVWVDEDGTPWRVLTLEEALLRNFELHGVSSLTVMVYLQSCVDLDKAKGINRYDLRREYEEAPTSPQQRAPERILCAALYIDDGANHNPRSHNYPKTGLVFLGWRHGDCFQVMREWQKGLESWQHDRVTEEQWAGRDQGFMTSRGRYVDRQEARLIAYAAGQVDRDVGDLFSEDLY